jgi:hypothetical protein
MDQKEQIVNALRNTKKNSELKKLFLASGIQQYVKSVRAKQIEYYQHDESKCCLLQ